MRSLRTFSSLVIFSVRPLVYCVCPASDLGGERKPGNNPLQSRKIWRLMAAGRRMACGASLFSPGGSVRRRRQRDRRRRSVALVPIAVDKLSLECRSRRWVTAQTTRRD